MQNKDIFITPCQSVTFSCRFSFILLAETSVVSGHFFWERLGAKSFLFGYPRNDKSRFHYLCLVVSQLFSTSKFGTQFKAYYILTTFNI